MFKITLLRSIVFTIVLTIGNNCAFAQQVNKPVTPAAANPTINPVPVGYPGDIQVNYVRTREAMGPFTEVESVINADYQSVKQATQYMDGMGRPLQTVSRQVTPQVKDMVTPVVYDEFGREVFKYLPYVSTENTGLLKTDPFNAQQTFMLSQYPDEQVYYSKTNYEASPLNRVSKTMSPGNSWAGISKGKSMEYLLNTDNDVRNWTISNNPLTYSNNDVNTNKPATTVYYGAGELYKNIMKDEANNVVVEYKDKEDKLVLKKVQVGNILTDYSGHEGFLCTYYVYDELNQLRFVIPPKAVEAIKGNWQFTDDNIINELCFRYEYDARKRMIAKKVPGSGWVYMIYDTRDRMVFSQDANLRRDNKWLITLYDGLDRQVMTGMMTWSGFPAALQQTVTWQTTTIVTPPGVESSLILPDDQHPLPANGFSGTYQAGNNITLETGFVSAADFTAEIVGGTNGGPQNIFIEGVPVNKNPIPPGAGFVALTKTYYDKYDWTNITYSPAYNSQLELLDLNPHEVTMPTVSNNQVTGLITGNQVRVITDPNNPASGQWLTTVNFYDDKNRIIQVNSDNHKAGKDIVTNRYNFTGTIISTYLDITSPAGTPASVHIKTDMKYDHAGRLLEVWKTINDEDNKKALIVKNEYDELGQLRNKKLGRKKDASGNYTNNALESLEHSYNIRRWITGINKDYVNNTGIPNAWFGMELNYDKGFQIPQYNGNIAGTKWRSKGDGERRAYGYSYDKANRILGADFSQFGGGSYADNGTVKFDMVMGTGLEDNSAYDENGNIKTMKQWGLRLNASNLIDELTYSYFDYSNKLKAIQDIATGGTPATGTGANLGDFADRNTNGNDYGYDENGNLVSDLNKRVNGTTGVTVTTGGATKYNYLNLPWQIPVTAEGGSAKGTITFIYDAKGKKLQKISFEQNGSVLYNGTSHSTSITTITNYISGVAYESKSYSNPALSALAYADKLQFIGHEEGRTRYIAAEDANPAHFEYDYFVKDHLGNVRMVLTEEQKTGIYQATMEDAKRSFEVELFGNKINTTVATKVGGFDNDGANAKVSLVNGTTAEGRVGPGVILKVMSGDKINARTFAWYQPSGMDNTTDPGLPAIIDNLLGQLAPGISGIGKGTAAQQITNSILQPGMQNLLNAQNPAGGGPKAYLNWILFDEEQFNAVSSGFVPVPQITGTQQKVLLQANSGNDIEMVKNGYLYVYVSNESRGNVYFDDIRIEHKRGALIEETHYYPFGLTMAGISSKGFVKPRNKFQYNGKEMQNEEFSDGSGLEWYDYGMREYDAQIGRFFRVDPISEKFYYLTPYQYASNDPIVNIDLDGLEGINNSLLRDCPTCAGTKESQSSDATKVKESVQPGTRVVKQAPLASFSISRGRQVGLKLASFGAEYNGGSKDLLKVTDLSLNTNIADKTVTKRGLGFQFGAINIGKEVESKTETVNHPLLNLPVEKTTSQVSHQLSVGIKGIATVGGERTKTYEQFGEFGDPVQIDDSGIKPVLGFSKSPERGGKVNGIEFSISIYYKVELKIDIIEALRRLNF